MARVAEFSAALGLLAWRVAVHPAQAWRDWLALLAAYWIFTAARPPDRVWRAGTVVAAAFLLVLYACGHLPVTFRHLAPVALGGPP